MAEHGIPAVAPDQDQSEATAGDLLLDLGVPFRIVNDTIYVEAQAHNGLLRWLENFPRVTVCAPTMPCGQAESSMRWTATTDLVASGRVRVSPFPWGYDVRSHLKYAGGVRRALRKLIPQHRYLCFSNLGWLGAWGRIGAEEAHKCGRPYAIWLDWVLHEMPSRAGSNSAKRAWHRFQHLMLQRTSIRDVRRCSLGLFHGRTVFDAYESMCKTPKVVHDIHLGQSDIITTDELRKRLRRGAGRVRIIYVGRVHEMKGPWHWLNVLQRVIEEVGERAQIEAEWIGDGPLVEQLRAAVLARGLAGRVSFPGAEMERQKLLARLRGADLFVFCHLTPESPRVLVEALMSGLPIVGFDSAYARELLEGHDGGIFVPKADDEGLSRAIVDCVRHPGKIAAMAVAALAAGARFSDVSVFRHRSDLIKEFL